MSCLRIDHAASAAARHRSAADARAPTAAFSTATQLAVIAGPAVGGLIYATTSPVLVYALCAVLYFTAGTFMSLIRIERIASTREPVSLAVLFAGFTFIRNSPIVLGAISLDLFAVLLGGASALLPVFARDVFGGGPPGWDCCVRRRASARS